MRTYVLDGAIKNDSECWHGGACADCQGCDTLPIRVTPQWATLTLGQRFWLKVGGLGWGPEQGASQALYWELLGVQS